MDRLRVAGEAKLCGRVICQGAKNSVLPILAGCLLNGGETRLYHVPRLRDVYTTLRILGEMGCKVHWEDDVLILDSTEISHANIASEHMSELRSSVVLVGAAIARCKTTVVGRPGGCELGPRPIDLHIDAFRKLGVTVDEDEEHLICTAERIEGTNLSLPFPSVGATENIMLLAATAKGVTVLDGAAKEPEIVDLQNFLVACGAKITGAGSTRVVIEGVPKLHGCDYRVMADRIVAATYLSAAAAVGGEVAVEEISPLLLTPVLDALEESGCEIVRAENSILLRAPLTLSAVQKIETTPYPGFPTDAAAPLMAALLRAKGQSTFYEGIFENRYRHVEMFQRMGAQTTVTDRTAVITGVPVLFGRLVEATDLRGGAALVIAAMAAKGESVIQKRKLIERGYEKFAETLCALGAKVTEE